MGDDEPKLVNDGAATGQWPPAPTQPYQPALSDPKAAVRPISWRAMAITALVAGVASFGALMALLPVAEYYWCSMRNPCGHEMDAYFYGIPVNNWTLAIIVIAVQACVMRSWSFWPAFKRLAIVLAVVAWLAICLPFSYDFGYLILWIASALACYVVMGMGDNIARRRMDRSA